MESNPLPHRNPFFAKKIKCPTDIHPSSNQAGSVQDCSLGNLRETIKNAMIPLLIKVFEMKLAAQQAKRPPSRLQKHPRESLSKIREQLELLLQDLNLLQLWCESSQKQILKALKETEEAQGSSSLQTASPQHPSNPAIEKSFSDAFSTASPAEEENAKPVQAHTCCRLDSTSLPIDEREAVDEEPPELPRAKKSWVRKFFS